MRCEKKKEKELYLCWLLETEVLEVDRRRPRAAKAGSVMRALVCLVPSYLALALMVSWWTLKTLACSLLFLSFACFYMRYLICVTQWWTFSSESSDFGLWWIWFWGIGICLILRCLICLPLNTCWNVDVDSEFFDALTLWWSHSEGFVGLNVLIWWLYAWWLGCYSFVNWFDVWSRLQAWGC